MTNEPPVPEKNQEQRSALFIEVIPHLMRLIRTEMRQVGKSKLTVPQFRLLNKVSKQPMSNHELAEWMGVSAPTMSKMIDSLVNKGLLLRKSEGSDRRAIQVEATKKGHALSQDIRAAVRKQFSERLAQIPENKLQVIEAGLLAMKEALL